ncbi:MAG: FAD:protein FMN transferase, partial [Verrucomicrobiaceae bacterium]
VDLAAERLSSIGVEHFLIEIGGELRGRGCKPDGEPWWVSLDRPSDELPETVVALCELSVATSGDAFRRHLIDPRTSSPVDGELVAVSVFAKECMDADAWATALFIAGADEGLKLAEQQKLPALFTLRTENGHAERWSSALGAMLG